MEIHLRVFPKKLIFFSDVYFESWAVFKEVLHSCSDKSFDLQWESALSGLHYFRIQNPIPLRLLDEFSILIAENDRAGPVFHFRY